MKNWFAILSLMLSALTLSAQTNIATEIEKLLPAAKGPVEVMGLTYPKRYLELAEIFQNAAATNKTWFLDYIQKNAKEGEPLPYHSKFGLTKKQYEEFLLLGEKRTLEKTGRGTLLVRTNASGYEFDGGSTLPDLTGLKINLKKLTLLTPFAVLKNPVQKESAGGPALGAYSGYQWDFEQSDLNKGDVTEASFLIGKLKQSGKYFIYYKGGVMLATNPISEVRIVITYDKK